MYYTTLLTYTYKYTPHQLDIHTSNFHIVTYGLYYCLLLFENLSFNFIIFAQYELKMNINIAEQ